MATIRFFVILSSGAAQVVQSSTFRLLGFAKRQAEA
jgi:hypothetical protein